MKLNKYWFKPKSYGYGYYPITWEGWITVLLIISILSISAYVNNFFDSTDPNTQQGFRYLLDITIFMFAINPIMLKRTEEEVTWKWGKK